MRILVTIVYIGMVNGTMFTDSFETQLPLAIAYYFGNIVISNFITLRYALPCGHVILDMIETSVTKGAEPTPRIKEVRVQHTQHTQTCTHTNLNFSDLREFEDLLERNEK